MNKLSTLALALPVAFIMSGCGSDSSSSSSTVPVTISVTDAPVDEVKEVVVTFGKLALLPQGEGSDPIVMDVYLKDEDGNPIDENGLPIPDGGDTVPMSINLLDYQGSDSASLIDDMIIPVGEYQLCLFANDGDHPEYPSYVIENDGTPQQLTVQGNGVCPQGVGREDNAGTLFFNDAFAVNQQSNDFAVEFELRRGLKNTSTFPAYSIQRTSVSLINTVETGNIEGEVLTSVYEACMGEDTDSVHAVYLYEGSVALEDMAPIGGDAEVKPITSAFVNQDDDELEYEFSFGYLDPGTYSLGYTCTAHLDSDEDNADPIAANFSIFDSISDVVVVVNDDTDVIFD